ncbi:FtsX-like permease family protein [Streptacidiphilus sp. MAP12-20]|uniref:FtsX-like permease family protein n=1 Tax=Streptacidiphilus sp. MAP12-20 TaxID=3156299 RepID=UPI0035199F75
MILAQLLRRRGRAFALAAGILVAATSFTLLTSAVTTSKAETVGTVNANSRAAYDLLVRPPGTRTALEEQRGQVESNFLSGIFGGISTDQYHRIGALPGVEVAAPVANIGYLLIGSTLRLDLSAFLDSGARNQLLRVRPVLSAGLGQYPMSDQYVYVTRDPLTVIDTRPHGGWLPQLQLQQSGTKSYAVCWYVNYDRTGVADSGPFTSDPKGIGTSTPSPFTPAERTRMTCEPGQGKTTVDISVEYPVLVTAIDPTAEARLVGLNHAITSGRMLTAADKPHDGVNGSRPSVEVPVLLSAHAMSAGTLTATVQRLDAGDPAALPARLDGPSAHAFITGLSGATVGTLHEDLATGFQHLSAHSGYTSATYWTVGPVTYRSTSSGLVAVTRPAQPFGIWRGAATQGWIYDVPEENTGLQFRAVTQVPSADCAGVEGMCAIDPNGRPPSPVLDFVGRYDASKLSNFSQLSDVPLETYQSPAVTGADAASRAALGDKPLLPDRNLGGYVSQPPTLLTTLASADSFFASRPSDPAQRAAPISAIRIRVAGVTGVDKASQARVNAVAAAIRAAYPTLAVDVTVGSSPMPQTVVLPAGVRVVEGWTAKGVALRILSAVDAKSAVLFVLVLVVCALFLGQAALASVRSRRTEIGTLRCVGWSAREIFRLVLGELLLIGASAGAAGALLAYALAAAFGLHTSAAKAALVLPTAILLALLAGLFPAWRATRVGPLDAVNPPVTPVRRARPVRTVRGLALRNLLRAPGRSALGAAGLALGVAAFTVLLGVTLAFHGEVAGSLLGNAVVAQARTVDYASVALSLLLGAAGAVDVLVLSQRERAADLAVLRACGWSGGELARLSLAEGVWLSALGGVLGAGAGLGVLATLGQGLLGGGRVVDLTSAGLLAAAAGVALVCTALTFAIRALARLAPARLLAADQ